MTDWANLLSGLVGGLVGAGGAVVATLITTRSDRATRTSERAEGRKDREAERWEQPVARRLDQGHAAARDALTITSQFFTNTVDPAGPNHGDSFIGYGGWDEIRRIDDLAELIDSNAVRQSVRSLVKAVGTAGYVTMLTRDHFDPEQLDLTYRRERELLILMRRTLGTYLRGEEEQYAALLAEARGKTPKGTMRTRRLCERRHPLRLAGGRTAFSASRTDRRARSLGMVPGESDRFRPGPPEPTVPHSQGPRHSAGAHVISSKATRLGRD